MKQAAKAMAMKDRNPGSRSLSALRLAGVAKKAYFRLHVKFPSKERL